MFSDPGIFFTWLCGGIAFRAVARTHLMLYSESVITRPHFLSKSSFVPVLVTIGFFGVLAASALLGWHHSGIFGLVLRPIQVVVASLLLELAINSLSQRLKYSFFLNPIVHLYIFPWIFIVGVVVMIVT
ncbi:MAG: hypothetical protein AB1515_07055 [Nitrospirota bacterium]